MPAARAGRLPNWWSAVSETTKTGRQRSTLSSGNQEWDLTEGWHAKRQRGWKGRGQKSGLVQKVQRTTPEGKTVTVYKTTGYDDTIGFHSHDEPDEDALAYAMNAFDKNDPSHGPIFEQDGAGHIAKIEYAQLQQVLRVTFRNNGSICLFYRVPTAVAGELLSLAQKGDGAMQQSTVDGTMRHTLGIVFWDLVRIRGQRHGARYPFEYESRGRYKLTGSGKRYSVVLSDENIKKVLGGRYYGRDLKPGETVTAILSEEEYAKWLEEEEHGRSALGEKRISTFSKDSGEGSMEVEGVAGDYLKEHTNTNEKSLREVLSPAEFARFLDLRSKMMQAVNKAEQDRQEEIANAYASTLSDSAKEEVWNGAESSIKKLNSRKKMSDGEYDYESFNSAYDKLVDDWLAQAEGKIAQAQGLTDADGDGGMASPFRDRRFKTYVEKATASRVHITPHDVFGDDKAALNDYLRYEAIIRRLHNPTKYAATYVGRPWTIGELESFANPTVPGAISLEHASLYKSLIAHGDYEAALNFLKNHKHDVYSNEKVIARRPYASQYDFIAKDGGTE